MKTIINISIITLCVAAVVFCCYELVTAECSYFNYAYLLGIVIVMMIGGEKVINRKM